MTLGITVDIKRETFLCQEPVEGVVRIRNRGESEAHFPATRRGTIAGTFRLRNLETGVERLQDSRSGEEGGIDSLPVKAGGEETIPFRLSLYFGEVSPGRYDLDLLVQDPATGIVTTSNRQSILVRPSTPTSLDLASRREISVTGAWVDLANEKPELVYGNFHLMYGGGVQEQVTITSVEPGCVPVVSTVVDPDQSRGWVGWTQGEQLRFALAEPGGEATLLEPIVIPARGTRLVGPLCPNKKDKDSCSSLLLGSVEGEGGSSLRVVKASPGQAELGEAVPLRGAAPAWIGNQILPDGSRIALVVQVDGDGSTLSSVAWSESSVSAPESIWKSAGSVVAIDSVSTGEGELLGALVVSTRREDQAPRLDLVTWSLEKKEFKVREETELGVEVSPLLARVQVHVNREGVPAVRFRDGDGNDTVIFEGQATRLPVEWRENGSLSELLFLGGATPFFLCAERDSGFQLRQLDGSILSRGI